MEQSSWQRLVIGLALAAGCIFIGATISTTNQALGETRGSLPQQPLLEDRQVPILREISGTLRQMDARIARLEVLAQKLSAKAASSTPRRIIAESADESTN